MPIYEYQCDSCNRRFEVMQRMSESPLATCNTCGEPVRRLISQTSFVLKGSGWYVTDYPSESRKKALSQEKNGADSKLSESKSSESKSSDSKSSDSKSSDSKSSDSKSTETTTTSTTSEKVSSSTSDSKD